MCFRRVVFHRSSEPKISNFINRFAVFVANKNVLRFDIAMNKLIAVNFSESVEDAGCYAYGLLVGKDLVWLLDLLVEEVSQVAVLQHHKKMIFR